MEENKTGRIYKAIIEIAKALPTIKKKSVGGDKSKFDAFVTEDIVAQVRPLMLEQGVIVVSRAVERQTEFITTHERTVARHYVFINHVFIADDGSSIETSSFGEGSGYNEEGLAKAHTRSLGAAMREIFLIVDNEKSEKREASKNFKQFWDRCTELKITDGKKVLADCGNDPLKAYEFICTRATAPTDPPPPAPKPSPVPTTPSAPPPAPKLVSAAKTEERSATDVLIDEIKFNVRQAGFARNPAEWTAFEKGCFGCAVNLLMPSQLTHFAQAVREASADSVVNHWVGESWGAISLAYKSELLGLIVAHRAIDGIVKTKAIVGDPSRIFKKESFDKIKHNLLSWVRPQDLERAA